MAGKQICETCSISCHWTVSGSSLNVLTYSETCTLQESSQHPVLLGQHEEENTPNVKLLTYVFPFYRVTMHAEEHDQAAQWTVILHLSKPGFLKAKVMWILLGWKLTKRSMGDKSRSQSRSQNCSGINYRYSTEKACLEQTEIWS